MTIRTHIIHGEKPGTEDTEAGEFIREGRTDQDVAADLSKLHEERLIQKGVEVGNYTMKALSGGENLYIVADYPDEV